VTIGSGAGRLAGLLALPDGAPEPLAPAVLLVHGLANDRDEAGQFPPLSARLVAAGCATLRIDARGAWRSAGEPGRMLVGSEWPHDVLGALTWLRDQDGVDPERIAVIGASAGGAAAVHAAAADRALRGVATLGSPADCARWFEALWTRHGGPEAWRAFLVTLAEDRRRRADGEPSRRVRLVGEFLAADPDEIPALEAFVAAHPGMVADLPLEVADDLLLFAPEHSAARLGDIPLLVVHGDADALVPLEEAHAYVRRASGPCELRVVRAGQHQLLLGEGSTDVIEQVVDWLAQRLIASERSA
jgi:pimeloyl-ACP methyl ester carboxylesterase